jgi:glycosyltransferase involved in cell wall biosynthesis
MPAVDFNGLKICFLAGTLAKGGAECQLFYMVRALRQNGACPRVLCFRKGEYWERPISQLGVPVTPVGRSRVGRIREIIRELRADRPDVLQSAHFYTNGYVQIAARVLGIREIGAIRCDLTSELSGRHAWLRRASLSALREIAANSRAAIESAGKLRLSRARLMFLPNVVDTDQFRPAPRKPARTIAVLGAGRLAEQKRFDRFLRVAARVRQTAGPQLRMLIAGDGPLRAALHEMAVTLGFNRDEVEFAGHIDDMRDLYRSADVFLLTSDYEGTPNVVLEAMASGLPVIATRVGDVPHLITDGVTGFLADPNDEDRIAETLARLVSDPALRDGVGRAAREHIVAKHSVLNMPLYLHTLYGGVLTHAPALMASR